MKKVILLVLSFFFLVSCGEEGGFEEAVESESVIKNVPLSRPVLLKSFKDKNVDLKGDIKSEEELIRQEVAKFAAKNTMQVRSFIDSDGKLVDEVIISGRPPETFRMSSVPEPNAESAPSGVPAFDWSYGCSATSAAMMAGFYDHNRYPNMYTGPTNGGVMPLNNSAWGDGECPLSATHRGLDGRTTRGNVDDYWVASLSTTPDPYITNGWAQHAYGDCTGDYMGTNQSALGNIDGSTNFYYNPDGSPLINYTGAEPASRDGTHGLRDFLESRGYVVQQNFNQYIMGFNGNTQGFTLADFRAEIDADRPVLIHLVGHTMLGYDYVSSTSTTIYVHDTWDYSAHTMTWGGSYSGMAHTGVSVIILAPPPCYCSTASSCCDGCYSSSSSTVCRPEAGICDIAENCDGQAVTCPTDKFKSSSIGCRTVAGICDVAENCTGSSAVCPTDKFESTGKVCRGSSEICEQDAKCTGSSAVCPANPFEPSTQVCRESSDDCDKPDHCSGNSKNCPEDEVYSSTTVCRDVTDICDVPENCNGSSKSCPIDKIKPAGEICREKQGDCDLTEYCDGSRKSCSVDRVASDFSECRPKKGTCDRAEFCDGTSKYCPDDAFLSSIYECRPKIDKCDIAEYCDGISAYCPEDISVKDDSCETGTCPDSIKVIKFTYSDTQNIKDLGNNFSSYRPNCENIRNGGKDVVYEIDFKKGKIYEITVLSDSQTSMAILESCTNPSCVTDVGIKESTMIFEATENETRPLIIEFKESGDMQYHLEIVETEKNEQGGCSISVIEF